MDEQNTIIAFVNPMAGRGLGAELVDELIRLLVEEGFSVHRADSIELLRTLVAEFRLSLRTIVSAGGDGTAETVVNITTEHDQCTGTQSDPVPIAVFPLGTENLLAKYLHIKASPRQVTALIKQGCTRQLDAGRANGTVFLLMLSCGFDADVVRRLHQGRHGNISHLAYALPMIDSIRNYDYPNLHVSWQLDGETIEQLDCHWAFCFNSPSYAAGLRIVADADPTDGLLDMATFAGGSFWHGLWQFSAVVLGQHHQMTEFRHARCRQLRISSPRESVPYQVDGDPGGFLPVEIEVLPQYFTVIADAAQEPS